MILFESSYNRGKLFHELHINSQVAEGELNVFAQKVGTNEGKDFGLELWQIRLLHPKRYGWL